MAIDKELDLSMFGADDFEENKIIDEVADDENDESKTNNDLNDGQEIDHTAPNIASGDDTEANDDTQIDDTDINNNDEKDDNNNDNNIKLVYNNIASLLKEEGLFTNEELDLTKIENSDSLVEALREEIKRNEFSDLSDTQREYLESIRNGVPEELFLEHKQAAQTYESITESMVAENEELRKNIIFTDLKSKGIGDSRINTLYKAMVESGDDVGEALSSLEELKNKESLEYQEKVKAINAQKQEQEAAEKARMKSLKDHVYDTKEIIKNYKITENLKNKVYETMTKSVGYNQAGQPINKLTSERDKNPIEFDTKLYYLFTMTNGFNDFSIFEKKAQSKAAEKLERIVRDTTLRTGSNPIVNDSDSQDVPQIVKLQND